MVEKGKKDNTKQEKIKKVEINKNTKDKKINKSKTLFKLNTKEENFKNVLDGFLTINNNKK